MAEFKYEINDAVATLSQSGDYTCEVNVITYGTANGTGQKTRCRRASPWTRKKL